jgi:hypothetical protein
LYWKKELDSKLFLDLTLQTVNIELPMFIYSGASVSSAIDSTGGWESTVPTLIAGDYIVSANGRMLSESDCSTSYPHDLNDTRPCTVLRYRRQSLSEDARQLFLAKFRAAYDNLLGEELSIVDRIMRDRDDEYTKQSEVDQHSINHEYVGAATWREFDLTCKEYQVFEVLSFLNLLLRICAAFRELRALDALCIEKTFTEACYPRVSIHCAGAISDVLPYGE